VEECITSKSTKEVRFLFIIIIIIIVVVVIAASSSSSSSLAKQSFLSHSLP
jgi:flagellar basal body-associated protein FliL